MGPHRQSGFSMIEVMLTFSILAAATTALAFMELSNARRSEELKARETRTDQFRIERRRNRRTVVQTHPPRTAHERYEETAVG